MGEHMWIILFVGDEPDESRGTRINLALSEEDRFHLWSAKVMSIRELTINQPENGTLNEKQTNKQKDKKEKKKNKKKDKNNEPPDEVEEECTYCEISVRIFTPPTCIVARWTLGGRIQSTFIIFQIISEMMLKNLNQNWFQLLRISCRVWPNNRVESE